jgi:hypothetical protein
MKDFFLAQFTQLNSIKNFHLKNRRNGKRFSSFEKMKKGNKKSRSEDVNENTKKRRNQAPTVREILQDGLTHLSLEYWAPLTLEEQAKGVHRKEYSPEIVESIYEQELKVYHLDKIILLELSHYLEK